MMLDVVRRSRRTSRQREVRLRRDARCPTTPTSRGAPQNSIIGGATLWVMGGKTSAGIQGRRQVLHLPVGDRRAGWLHQVSGYLPITKAAYDGDQGVGLLREEPRAARSPIQQLTASRRPSNSRGLRLGNMRADPRHLGRGDRGGARRQEDRPRQALDAAVDARQRRSLRQFERTVDALSRDRAEPSADPALPRDAGAAAHLGPHPRRRGDAWRSARSSAAAAALPAARAADRDHADLLLLAGRRRRCASRSCCRTRSGSAPSSSGSRTSSDLFATRATSPRCG